MLVSLAFQSYNLVKTAYEGIRWRKTNQNSLKKDIPYGEFIETEEVKDVAGGITAMVSF